MIMINLHLGVEKIFGLFRVLGCLRAFTLKGKPQINVGFYDISNIMDDIRNRSYSGNRIFILTSDYAFGILGSRSVYLGSFFVIGFSFQS